MTGIVKKAKPAVKHKPDFSKHIGAALTPGKWIEIAWKDAPNEAVLIAHGVPYGN